MNRILHQDQRMKLRLCYFGYPAGTCGTIMYIYVKEPGLYRVRLDSAMHDIPIYHEYFELLY